MWMSKNPKYNITLFTKNLKKIEILQFFCRIYKWQKKQKHTFSLILFGMFTTMGSASLEWGLIFMISPLTLFFKYGNYDIFAYCKSRYSSSRVQKYITHSVTRRLRLNTLIPRL